MNEAHACANYILSFSVEEEIAPAIAQFSVFEKQHQEQASFFARPLRRPPPPPHPLPYRRWRPQRGGS